MLYVLTSEVLDTLFSKFNFRFISSKKLELSFYDTYCNELAKNLEYLVKTKEWYELCSYSGELVAKTRNTNEIVFAWDSHDKNFKSILKNLIEYRALLLKNKLIATQSLYLALNSYDKGVFRLYKYEINEHILIKLEPIRGFQTSFLEATEVLSVCNTISALHEFVKQEVTKPQKPKLDKDMSAKDAISLLLNDIYKQMKEQEFGIISNIDSEFLHYYRVYLRKARALISQFKSVFNPDELIKVKLALSQIGRTTNEARDLDVYWIKVREYQDENLHRDFSQFLDFLKQSSKNEYKNLSKFFKSAEYKTSCAEFESLFNNQNYLGGDSNTNILALVTKKIKKQYKKLLSDGLKLSLHSEDELFHELRIDCKKMRYLLESFEQILDKQNVSLAIKLIKNLQTILGNFQDLSVQQQKIISLAESMTKKLNSIDAKTLISIGTIVAELEREQKKCKKLFFQNFNEFVKIDNQDVFKALYRKEKNDNHSDL